MDLPSPRALVWILLAAPVGGLACTAPPPSKVHQLADDLCACKDITCADTVHAELERVIDLDDPEHQRELDRSGACHQKLRYAADPAAEARERDQGDF